MNTAISWQNINITFILIGYRDVLKVSVFVDYEWIFNKRLQPRGK